MAVRPIRRPDSSKTTPQYSANVGPFTGMAQDGPARKARPTALAEEILSRGCAFVEKGIWDDAEREFRKALKMAADYPEAYNNLGLCLLYQGNPADARVAFQEALSLFPGWASAEANLGLAFQQLEEHAESAKYYRQSLVHKNPQPQVSLSLGDVLNAQGQADEALASWQKALESIPNYAAAHSRIGILHARKGRINEAEASLLKAVQLDPSNADAYAVLGSIAARRGNFRQAKDLFGKIPAETVSVAAQRGTQRIALCEAAVKSGFAEFKSRQPEAKPMAECYYELGLALLADGNSSEAQSMFQRAAQYDAQWLEPQLFLAYGEALLGNGLSAKSAFEVAAKLAPDNGMVAEQLGYLALGMGVAKEADAQLKRAQSLGRNVPPELVKADA